ncbi:Replication protein A 70 kDa DNA-binding subunit B [Bienertia sinuspersici]
MKPEYTSLNKLTDKSKDYKVKVRVIDKTQPLQTPKKYRYQRLVLKDDEGNTIRGTLFGNDIESFEQALRRNGEYEISGAPVQQVRVEHQKKPNEYRITFNETAKITPLATGACCSEPNYLKLTAIPRTQTVGDNSLDVIAIVLFVSDVYPVKQGSVEYPVRKVLLVDDSCQRQTILSAWNDLAHVEWFTGIRVATYNGFSLTTTMSTFFVMDPTGEKADALRLWAMKNVALLNQMRSKTTLIWNSSTMKTITPVEEVESKKAHEIWEEDICGRRIYSELGVTFDCVQCNTRNATAVLRATLTLFATDGIGAIKATAFGEEVELLLGVSSDKLFSMKKSVDENLLEEQLSKVRKAEKLIQVGPTNALTASEILKWVVRNVSAVEEED